MTPEDRKILAEAANRIMLEPAFVMAMGQLRERSMEALLAAEPTDPDAIRQHQAMVRAVDGLVSELKNIVIAASGRRPALIA